MKKKLSCNCFGAEKDCTDWKWSAPILSHLWPNWEIKNYSKKKFI